MASNLSSYIRMIHSARTLAHEVLGDSIMKSLNQARAPTYLKTAPVLKGQLANIGIFQM